MALDDCVINQLMMTTPLCASSKIFSALVSIFLINIYCCCAVCISHASFNMTHLQSNACCYECWERENHFRIMINAKHGLGKAHLMNIALHPS